MSSITSRTAVARRPRAFIRVSGPDAQDFLQRMLSNDVAAADTCEALLLTPRARVIAPVVVVRRAADDFLLLTEPELGEVLRTALLRARLRAVCEIESEEHSSTIVLGGEEGIPTSDYGVPARELLDAGLEPTIGDEELDRLRIEAGTPRFGREIDDRVLPAEAGLIETHVSFSKGCYPGQEPVARLHHRGKVNRRLRVLELDGEPETDELLLDGKVVGRITSRAGDVGLGYVRVEVPEDAVLAASPGSARLRRQTEG